MPIYDSKGLLEGKRLRKLTPYGHVLWPFIFCQGSERYARLEIDPELILQKLGHLAELLDFEIEDSPHGYDPERAVPNLNGVLTEYVKQQLAFRYTVKGNDWLVFDKPNGNRVDFERTEDNDAPAPPEPAYTDWLKSIHYDDWADFHPGELAAKTSAARSAAGLKGANVRWQKDGKNDTVPDLPSAVTPNMAGDGTTMAGDGKNGIGSRQLVVGYKVTGEGNSNCTVQDGDGTVARPDEKHEKPEPETTEMDVKRLATEIFEVVWDERKEAHQIPLTNDDITNFGKLLIQHPYLTVEEIDGVLLWMLYVNKDKKTGKPYWLPRIKSSEDFCRAFRKMEEQYEQCGGFKVAKVAERLALEKLQSTETIPVEEMETFRVEPVNDADGLD